MTSADILYNAVRRVLEMSTDQTLTDETFRKECHFLTLAAIVKHAQVADDERQGGEKAQGRRVAEDTASARENGG